MADQPFRASLFYVEIANLRNQNEGRLTALELELKRLPAGVQCAINGRNQPYIDAYNHLYALSETLLDAATDLQSACERFLDSGV